MLTKARAFYRTFSRFSKLSNKRLLLLVVAVAIASVVGTTTISVLLSHHGNWTIPSIGTVKTVGVDVYKDHGLGFKLERVEWGEIWVGESKTVTIYVRSISNNPIQLLIQATDWNPSFVSSYMSLSWDYSNTEISPGEVLPIRITLNTQLSYSFIKQLASNNIQNFNVNICIAAVD